MHSFLVGIQRRLLRSVLALSLPVVLMIGGVQPASGSDVTTFAQIRSTEAEIKGCGVAYRGGPAHKDSYTSASINTRPDISAPTQWLTIRVSFDQDCYDIAKTAKYNRSLALISPSGAVTELFRDRSASSARDRTYSIYCQISLCWSHTDVYQVRFSETAESGQYGLRFSTTYRDTVCTSSSGSIVCESNVPHSKTFDVPNFLRVTQTTVPTPTPIPAATQPVEPVVEPKLGNWVTSQLTLRKSSGRSVVLSVSQKQQLEAFLEANSFLEKLTCTGVRLSNASTSDNLLVRSRAKAACDYAASLIPGLSTWVQSKPTSSRSYSGRVMLAASTYEE
jgi:hypothetical protein